MKPLERSSKMMPPSRIVLLTLCAILTGTDLISGFVIRKPSGQCPPALPGVRCLSIENQCENSNDCDWNEKCCSNGCGKVCIRVSSGLPSVPTEHPLFGPFHPPVKPHIPFPYNPPDPIPERPRLPPIWFPPMDPYHYEADDYHFPVFPRNDDFP